MAADTPPALQHLPTSKEKRYDRQLRLWAASGQAALEDAHVLLINAGPGATGVEALKNLVLPGMGHFTIQDSAIVAEADLGLNFFLEDSSLGKMRAAENTRYLLELNPDVQGHAVTEPLAAWLSSGDVLNPYTIIIIAASISLDILHHITAHAEQRHIPLVQLHSVGFYSHFSLLLPPAYPIVDTHPEPTATTDLRLLTPWPALSEFVQQKTDNMQGMSAFDLGHIPYVVLLIHYLSQWRAANNGQDPLNDKPAFRSFVRASGPPEEENYAEAAAAVMKTIKPSEPDPAVFEVLNGPETVHLGPESASFWFVSAAVQVFYQNHGELPLPGALPDMKAQSADYIALQNIYKTKARQDCAEVSATVRALEAQHGRAQPVPAVEIEQFCKLAAHIKLIRGSPAPLRLAHDPLAWSMASGGAIFTAVQSLQYGIDTPVLLYIAFVAYDAFLTSHDMDGLGNEPRPPGASDMDIDTDAHKLTGIACKVFDAAIDAAGQRIENPHYDHCKAELGKLCQELTRAGGAELHNVASLTGGMVAQEVIKVITRQYVPLDNVCVFDGIKSSVGVFRIC